MKTLILASTVVATLLVSVPAIGATASGDLRVFVMNIGQGDAILVVCPHGTHRMLIDSGARGYPGSQPAFQAQMRALVPGVRPTLEVVVSTHPHEDHIGGLQWILSTFRVKKFVDSGQAYTSSFAGIPKAVADQVASGTLKHFRADQFPPARIVDFCPATNVTARLLIPKDYGKASNLNNDSVVVLVTYDGQKFLFTGDAEREEEKLLLSDATIAPLLKRVAFYKVGHHGANTSSTQDFLNVIEPHMAGLSSGCKDVAKNQGNRHPRAATLAALNAVIPGDGIDVRSLQAGQPTSGWTKVEIHRGVYATPVDGTFAIISDGRIVSEKGQRITGAPGACVGQ